MPLSLSLSLLGRRVLGACLGLSIGATALTQAVRCASDSESEAGKPHGQPSLPQDIRTLTAAISDNPFLDEALVAHMPHRVKSNKIADAYLRKIASKAMRELYEEFKSAPDPEAREEVHNRVLETQRRIDQDMQIIVYGVAEEGARRTYNEKYGCVQYTERSMDLLRQLSPIVEIGAGGGQWAQAMRERNISAVAFDNDSTDSPPPVHNRKSLVKYGDESVVWYYPHRTLLLVAPPPTDMALNSIKGYDGDVVVYVGEGRGGGIQANEAFFDYAEEHFHCVHIEELLPFSNCFERMYILRRKDSINSSGNALKRVGRSLWALFF